MPEKPPGIGIKCTGTSTTRGTYKGSTTSLEDFSEDFAEYDIPETCVKEKKTTPRSNEEEGCVECAKIIDNYLGCALQ